MEALSNYEITKRKTAEAFLKYDQEKMIAKFALKHDENYLYIRFLAHDYRIDRRSGLLEWSEDDFKTCVEGNFNEALTIYDLLCDSKDYCQASGDFINLNSLSSLQSSTKKLGDGLFDNKDKAWDHQEIALSKACESLGGIKAGKGDVAYEIPLFEYVSCRVQFWNSDEDFEASLQIFMDKNILNFIRYETVWYAVGHLKQRLMEEFEYRLLF